MKLTEADARADVAELLFLNAGELADDADLFDAGLDSVRMMTLVERWREAGAEVSFVDLAERPTFAQWWALLSDA